MDKRILEDLQESYDIRCCSFSRVHGGYKNELWHVETKEKLLIVKVFSKERFSPGKIENINAALLRQQAAHEMGVACPQVYLASDRAVRCIDNFSYMVMDWCAGNNETPESVTCAQLRSLGQAVGKMHAAFSHLPGDLQGYAHAPENLLSAIHALSEKREDVADISRTWMMEKLQRIPAGMAHEDMTADNVLFDERGVTAIIDFDRCCFGYPLHDVGRALLSFSLADDGFDTEKMKAFVQGYRSALPLSQEDVLQALELTWLIEAPWWLHADEKQLTGKARRFRDELIYLTQHYADIANEIKID